MRKSKYIIVGVLAVAIIAAVVFFGVQFFTGTGIFKKPGMIYYDALGEELEAEVNALFPDDLVLDKDVIVSVRKELVLPELSENEFLYKILVPVTDFYSLEEGVNVEGADELFTNCLPETCGYEMISVDDLDFSRKLLKINSQYYLDDFDAGAVFVIVKFDSEKYTEEIAPLVSEKMTKEFPTKENVLTLAQTGVSAFSRRMNAKMNEVDSGAYFAENIGDFLSSFDLTHTSNESSFSDWAPTAGVTGTPICADQRFKETFLSIGLDIVELTGNHNLDCGADAARESVEWYKENGIKLVGGGSNAEEAAIPLEIDLKGNKVTMLAYNESTGGATYGSLPGANQYYEEVAREQIAEAKERGDVVIVDIQYYECNAYASEYEDPTCDAANSAAGDQIGLFRDLIDMGADVVVGTSAHQPQTYELYGGGVIYYGLGNLFFDQIKWPGTTRSLVLVHHFYKDKLIQTEIVPTVYDGDFQTGLMDEETKKWYLERLQSVRP